MAPLEQSNIANQPKNPLGHWKRSANLPQFCLHLGVSVVPIPTETRRRSGIFDNHRTVPILQTSKICAEDMGMRDRFEGSQFFRIHKHNSTQRRPINRSIDDYLGPSLGNLIESRSILGKNLMSNTVGIDPTKTNFFKKTSDGALYTANPATQDPTMYTAPHMSDSSL
jgi:hypothetical protein